MHSIQERFSFELSHNKQAVILLGNIEINRSRPKIEGLAQDKLASYANGGAGQPTVSQM